VKVLLDANVVVATFAGKGTCHEVYRECLDIHQLLTSEAILAEVKRILKGKLKAAPDAVERHLDEFRKVVVLVEPAPVPRSACRDADDLHVLGAAVAAHADVLVSGDDHLLELREYKGTRIFRPGDMLRRLAEVEQGARKAGESGSGGGLKAGERPRRYARSMTAKRRGAR